MNYEQLGAAAGRMVDAEQGALRDSFSGTGNLLRALYPLGIPTHQMDDIGLVMRILATLYRMANTARPLESDPYLDITGYALLGQKLWDDRKQQERARMGELQRLADEERKEADAWAELNARIELAKQLNAYQVQPKAEEEVAIAAQAEVVTLPVTYPESPEQVVTPDSYEREADVKPVAPEAVSVPLKPPVVLPPQFEEAAPLPERGEPGYRAWLQPEKAEQIRKWVRRGMLPKEIARKMGVEPGVLFQWKAIDVEFAALFNGSKAPSLVDLADIHAEKSRRLRPVDEWLTPERKAQIRQWMSQDPRPSLAALARLMGKPYGTLFTWRDKYPEFAELLEYPSAAGNGK